MGDWTLGRGVPYCWNPSSGDTEYTEQISPGASVNVKGSWVEVIASTPVDLAGLVLNVNAVYNNREYLIDIGIGAAASEVVIAANLLYGHTGLQFFGISSQYNIPIQIPAGTRVAIRQQAVYSSPGNWIKATLQMIPLNSFNYSSFQCCDTYGANTADTGGVSVDPGGTANTKGSWVELTSATERPVRALFFSLGAANDIVKTSCYWAIDIGVGGAGSEVALVQDFNVSLWATSDQMQPQTTTLFYLDIPEGTRIAARSKCTITTATDRLLDLVCYCFS